MKLIDDTLKNDKQEWDENKLTALVSFLAALAYEFVLPFFEVPTKEYVFITLVSLTASALGLIVWNKVKVKE